MDLSNLSISQLEELLQSIPAEIKRRKSQEKGKALNEVRAVAKSLGYTIEELFGKDVKVKSESGKVKPKYRHPNDASLEWTGRGRKPKWVEAWLAEGKSLESLSI